MALIKYEDYLTHYGTKGMKWGVRKDVYKSASRSERRGYKRVYDDNIYNARVRVNRSDEYANHQAYKAIRQHAATKEDISRYTKETIDKNYYVSMDKLEHHPDYAMSKKRLLENLWSTKLLLERLAV